SSSSNSLVGEGSGIIMGEDSSKKYTYIVTCAHVISSVKTSGYTMTVTDYEGNNYDGILVGYDSKTDVGVIKIAKTGLTAAEFGDSTTLKKGQTVYAIGNPGGSEFFGSFTKGMVSAIDRPISSESGYEMKCIQHTTPINSGNSGGALMNEYGQVIGINSSKIVSTGYEGMAFAIPISDAKEIIDDIIANGYVTDRPKLGISYAAAEKYQQYAMVVKLKGLPSGSLVIASISTDSSLANSKAKVGDLITAVNGEKLDTADVLLDKIENGKVGDKLKLELCRINSDYSVDTFTVEATLVEDKGNSSETETTTESQAQGGYDWSQFFGSGY
ncbi:MAG: trypsin-like peptidase domain-containing protein, partial [Clostridia bacterium]|nr:trypsin-like peptidase domain-containing protein [Clostridia bacterium]